LAAIAPAWSGEDPYKLFFLDGALLPGWMNGLLLGVEGNCICICCCCCRLAPEGGRVIDPDTGRWEWWLGWNDTGPRRGEKPTGWELLWERGRSGCGGTGTPPPRDERPYCCCSGCCCW